MRGSTSRTRADLREAPHRSGYLEGLTPNVVRLGWVSLFADVASEMLYPILPLFLTAVLGAPVAALGFVEGVAEAIASLLKPVAGRLSDRRGKRKPFVIAGYGLSALAKPLIAAASGWGLILFSRSLDRLGKALRSAPRDALLADSVEAEHRGKAFGLHRGMDTAGAVIGPLLALALIALLHDDLRWVFVAAFLPGLCSALLVLFVREQPGAPSVKATRAAFKDLPGSFRLYLLAWGVFSLANSSDMFLILRSRELGFGNTGAVLLYVLYNCVYALGSPALGKLSDSIGRRKLLVFGLIVFALVYLGFALSTARWQLWFLYAVYGLYIAATDGVGKALAVDLVPRSSRAGAIGLLGAVTGLAALFASTCAGLLWSRFGSWATFSYGAAGALLAAVLIGLAPVAGSPAQLEAGAPAETGAPGDLKAT